MKIMAAIISLIAVIMVLATWNTPAAMAWTVAFCGWLPHVFPSQDKPHAQS
jgi:uncharacterized membrane protein